MLFSRKPEALDLLLESQEFFFDTIDIKGINNEPVFAENAPHLRQEEVALFHKSASTAQWYIDHLDNYVKDSIFYRKSAAIVRFADGEYAYYSRKLDCNGLYRQAESRRAITESLPMHTSALSELFSWGKAAPLLFPGNTHHRPRIPFGLLRRYRGNTSGRRFLNFLLDYGIKLSHASYVPFYTVYAYLTSEQFIRRINSLTIALISSEIYHDKCRQWFEQRNCAVDIVPVNIPHEYVATQWETIKPGVLAQIPDTVDLCLVGAGIGALLVCVDIAKIRSLPAIDAGHVINMINDQVIRSNGPRLFTQWKTS